MQYWMIESYQTITKHIIPQKQDRSRAADELNADLAALFNLDSSGLWILPL